MKKFFVILLLAGLAFAAFWFYDPYLKPHVDKVIELAKGFSGKDETPAPDEPSAPTDGQPVSPSTTPKPATPDRTTTTPPPSPTQPTSPTDPAMSELDKQVAEQYPMPVIRPLSEIVGPNWQLVPENAYPASVTIDGKISFVIRDRSGQIIGSSVADAGTLVKPVRLDGDNLIIANRANEAMLGSIHVDRTDFKQQITDRYNTFVETSKSRVLAIRGEAKKAMASRPQTATPGATWAVGWDDPADDRFDPVKASLANGEVRAVRLEEARQFRWNGPERVLGDTYDTVTVHFEVHTIFGVFPNDFKCLLKDGRVVKWIDPITLEDKI